MSLYIFDKDGTLLRCERKGLKAVTPPLKCDEQVLLPGVFEKIAALRAAGHRVAIASNQPAVAKGVITLTRAQELMENCAAKLGGVDAWRVSPFDPRARKHLPRGGRSIEPRRRSQPLGHGWGGKHQ